MGKAILRSSQGAITGGFSGSLAPNVVAATCSITFQAWANATQVVFGGTFTCPATVTNLAHLIVRAFKGPLAVEIARFDSGFTSSAVIADVVSVAQDILLCTGNRIKWQAKPRNIKPMDEVITRYYIRMSVTDQAGVITQITRVLGDNQISISALVQKETDVAKQTAEIVIMTHPANEAAMQKALKEMEKLSVVKEISNFIRVEDL